MKTKRSKIITILLAAVLMLSMFAGCSSGDGGPGGDETPAGAGTDGTEAEQKDDGPVTSYYEAIPPQFYSVCSSGFSEGLASVMVDDKWGFIDKDSKEVIPFIYDDDYFSSGYVFSEGLAAIIKGGKRGYIDKEGNEVIPFIYDYAYDFYDGIAAVENEDSKWGFVDQTGAEVIPFIYDKTFPFYEGAPFAAAKVGEKWGFIGKDGRGSHTFHIRLRGRLQ